jgi:prepilin-type N-terminal cleavage/methylation domain-containing protein
MKTLRNRGGFTLVEMLTVIAIIGILAGMLFKIGSLISIRTARAQGAERLEHLKLCIEGYYKVYGEYPRASGGSWEKPGASAGTPQDWDNIEREAQAGDSTWQNPGKEHWEELYPYIYEDAAAGEWREFSERAGGGGAGIAVNTADSGDLGFEHGKFGYTNLVFTIYDGMGGSFNYESKPPYQTYDLTSGDGTMGNGWTQ